MRYTPKFVNNLAPNEIFVYGANEAGIHGAGAARTAVRWGAEYGKHGFNGQTYGIPTKDANIETISVNKIKVYVDSFLVFAAQHPELTFLVTPIGTGLAGYEPEDIAPLFSEALDIKNVLLPAEFATFLVGRPVKKKQTARASRRDLKSDYEQE